MTRKVGVFFSFILLLLETVSSLLYTPFMIRSFGQAEYGVYSLVLSITTYLALLDLGVGNALIRYFTKFRVDNDNSALKELKGLVLIFYSSMALLCVLIGVGIVYFFPNVFSSGLSGEEILLSRKLLLITIANIAVTFISTPYSKILIAYEMFSISKIIEICKVIIRVTASFIILKHGGRSIEITLTNFICTVLFGLFTCFIANRKTNIKPIFSFKEKTFVKEIAIYTSFLFVSMIAAQINNMTDHVLLGIFTTSSIIAVYQVGALITQYYQSIASAVNGVLQPGAVRMIESGYATAEKIENEMIKIGRIIFIILSIIYSVFLVNGRTFIYLWVGDGYEKSYYVTLILLFPLLLILPQNIGSQFLYALDRHKVQAYLKLAVSIINIAFTLFLIHVMDSVIGAAIGTATAEIVGDYIVFNCVFKKELRINIIHYNFGIIKRTIMCLLISVVIGYALSLIVNHATVLVFIMNCFTMVLVYVIALIVYGFNDYEKKLFISMLKHR